VYARLSIALHVCAHELSPRAQACLHVCTHKHLQQACTHATCKLTRAPLARRPHVFRLLCCLAPASEPSPSIHHVCSNHTKVASRLSCLRPCAYSVLILAWQGFLRNPDRLIGVYAHTSCVCCVHASLVRMLMLIQHGSVPTSVWQHVPCVYNIIQLSFMHCACMLCASAHTCL
jgi:hypothetical protein